MATVDAEHELVEQAVAGDRLSLERLLLLHASRLAQHLQPRISNVLQGVIDVDDILQQTFLQVFRDISTFQPRGQGSFFAWLRGIAENRLYDCVRELKRKKRGGDRKRQRTAGHEAAASAQDILNVLSAQNGTPSQSIARREAVQAIQVGVAGLPDDQRDAVRLHCIEGRSLAETAETMGKTTGAVRALIHRGKQKLQESLDRSAIWMSRGQ